MNQINPLDELLRIQNLLSGSVIYIQRKKKEWPEFSLDEADEIRLHGLGVKWK